MEAQEQRARLDNAAKKTRFVLKPMGTRPSPHQRGSTTHSPKAPRPPPPFHTPVRPDRLPSPTANCCWFLAKSCWLTTNCRQLTAVEHTCSAEPKMGTLRTPPPPRP